MTENQRTVVLGIFVAGLIILSEGVFEYFPEQWESVAQRDVTIGGLFILIAATMMWTMKTSKR